MKISDVIRDLAELQAQYGDIEVVNAEDEPITISYMADEDGGDNHVLVVE